MARPLRIERAGTWYHVTGRGIERRVIYTDDRDRRRWLALLAEAASSFRWRVCGYVLIRSSKGSPIRADVNRQKSFRSQDGLHRVDSLRGGKSTLQRAIRVRELRGHLELSGHRAEGSVNSIDNCAHLHASGVSLDTEMKSTCRLLAALTGRAPPDFPSERLASPVQRINRFDNRGLDGFMLDV